MSHLNVSTCYSQYYLVYMLTTVLSCQTNHELTRINQSSKATCLAIYLLWHASNWQDILSLFIRSSHSVNLMRNPFWRHVISLQNSISTSPSPRSSRPRKNLLKLYYFTIMQYSTALGFSQLTFPDLDTICEVTTLEPSLRCWFHPFLEEVKLALTSLTRGRHSGDSPWSG